ncbi:MAG: ferritin family protein [Spirochaetales bacterium]|nr:ferritin family protein [Spirochaetales bacterium]
MEEHFDAYEILTLAQSMEDNAVEFYENACKMQNKKKECDFLLKLAAMEKEHKELYANMQSRIKKASAAPADAEIFSDIDLYLKAVLDSQSMEGSQFASMLLRGDESLREILLIAIDLEKETILFYVGLKDTVTEAEDKEIVDKIIQEEKGHIVTLVGELRNLD